MPFYPGRRSIAWTDNVELSADCIYLELTGKKPEDWLPRLSVVRAVDA